MVVPDWATPALLLGSVAFFLWGMMRLFRSPQADVPASEDWWKEYDPTRYAPMELMLDDMEFDAMRIYMGYSDEEVERFRDARMLLFERYLVSMRQDFNRLVAIGQARVTAGTAPPELQQQMMQEKVRFKRALLRVRMSLMLYRAGFGGVESRPVLARLLSATSALRG